MTDTIDRMAIRHIMLDKGLSQSEIARKTGFDRNTISNFLKGKQPSYSLVQAIKEALEMSDEQAGQIFFGKKLA